MNSAIALATQSLATNARNINFLKPSQMDLLKEKFRIDTGKNSNKTGKPKKENKNGIGSIIGKAFNNSKGEKMKLDLDFTSPLDGLDKGIITLFIGALIVLGVYSGFSIMLSNKMDKKQKEAENTIAKVNSQISLIETDTNKINTLTSKYTSMIQNLEEINSKIISKNQYRNAVTTFLNELAFVIPTGVRIDSIKTVSGKKIQMEVEATEYEQLGYLKAKLKTAGLLNSVVSGSAVREGEVIKTTIEGELP